MTRPAAPPSRDASVTAARVAAAICATGDQPLPPGRADRRYCSNRCRQAGWRRRRQPGAAPLPPLPARRSRREGTVYACDDCGARYLGEQWCVDCTRPARRLGPGGTCGHCQEPLTVDELLHGELQP